MMTTTRIRFAASASTTLMMIMFILLSSSSVRALSDECSLAYHAVKNDVDNVCNIGDISPETLRLEAACPTECQELYDNVKANCKVGDMYKPDESLSSEREYVEATLFFEEGHKWADCDYAGYAPTECERAQRYLDFHGRDGCNPDNNGLTINELPPCPQDCQALYDDITNSCQPGDKYFLLGADSKWTYRDGDLFLFEGYKWATCDYGYPASDCEQAYNYMSHYQDEGTCSTFDLSVTELQSQECPSEYQDLYDHVMENCVPKDDIYLKSLGIELKYGEALIYHEQEYYKRETCNYHYEPTACDVAYENLQHNSVTDFGIRPVNATPPVCLYNENQDVCTPECIEYIDAVLLSCNDTAKFSPNGGYFDRTHAQIKWEGTKTLQWLGLDPTVTGAFAELGSLSEMCWTYYLSKAPATPSSASSGKLDQPAASLALSFLVTVFVFASDWFY